MFGGNDSHTSAYMLQYRKYDPSLKSHDGGNFIDIKITDDLVPDYLKEDIEKETQDAIET